MPLSRDELRRNITILLQFQTMRQQEHGQLLLAVWYDIEPEASDVRLVEVFENFRNTDGENQAELRFPGIGQTWIPGLYYIAAFSREAFEQAVREQASVIKRIRESLAANRGEVLYPPGNAESDLRPLLS